MTKSCTKCGVVKSFAEFSNSALAPDTKQHHCKACVKINSDEYYKKNKAKIGVKTLAYQRANPEKVRSWQLKYNFGISAEQYDVMVENQNGLCAICDSPDPRGPGRFHVDHDHTTGKVRGLLCNNCNLGLGFFADNITKLASAVKYLSK